MTRESVRTNPVNSRALDVLAGEIGGDDAAAVLSPRWATNRRVEHELRHGGLETKSASTHPMPVLDQRTVTPSGSSHGLAQGSVSPLVPMTGLCWPAFL